MSGSRPTGRYPPDTPDPRFHPGLPMPPAHGIPPRPDFYPPNQQQYNSPRSNFPPPSLPAPPGRYSPAVGPGSGSRAYDERFAPNNAFPPAYGSPGPQGLPLPPKMSYPPRDPVPLSRPPPPVDDRMPPPPLRTSSGGGAGTPGGAGWQQQGGRVHDERWDYHGGRPPPPGAYAGLPPHPGSMNAPQRPPSSSGQYPLPPHSSSASSYPPPRASYPDDRNGPRASTSSSSYRPHSPPRSYSRPDHGGPPPSGRYRSPSPDYSRSPRRHRSPSPYYRARERVRERERERDYFENDSRHIDRDYRSHHRRPRSRSRTRSPVSRTPSPSPPPRRRRRGSSCSSPGISRSPESPRARRSSVNAKAGVWRRGRSASRTPSASSDSGRGYRSSRSTSRDRRKRSSGKKRRHRDEETYRSGGRRKHSPESERRSSGHKRRRSTDERARDRGDERDLDAVDSKKAKTASAGTGYAAPPQPANGARGVYPPPPPQNGAPERASYPPPSGPRVANDHFRASTSAAPGNAFPPPGPPLHRPPPQHPNALPLQPGGAAVKVQLAPPAGPRAPTGPKTTRPGFVPIGQQAQQQQQQRLAPGAQRGIGAGVPTGPRNGPVAGDVRRFFPGDEEEDDVAKKTPSGPARGSKPPAQEDKGKDGPSWQERPSQPRSQDDRGWVTRQGGDVPPPRRPLPPDEDDRSPPRQPKILDPSSSGGPPQPAVLHRASYERPGSGAARPAPAQHQQQPRTGGPAPTIPPLVAPRQWGAAPNAPAAHASFTPPDANGPAIPAGPASRASSSSATPALTAPPSPKAMDRMESQPAAPPTPSNPPTPVPAAPAEAATAAAPPPPPPTELYERLVQVGEGTYGKVYKARNVETGGLVALKRIRMEAEKDGFPVTAVREIKLLQTLRHPNVVELVEMLVSKGQVYMVLEYVDHDLTGVLHHPSIEFSPAHLKSLMQQFLEGLGFIHRRGVLHRDLKGSNILLSKRGELKIADFGLARFYQRGRNNDYTNRVITQWYKPPELLFGATVYDERVDMWSAGCIFLELFARRPIFPGQDEIHQLDVIFKLTGTPNVENWPGLQDLPWYELVKPKEVVEPRLRQDFAKYLTAAGLDVAEALLALDPARRPTADEALKMPYFTSEEPRPEMPTMLADVEGEWHEYESKRQRRRQRGDEGI